MAAPVAGGGTGWLEPRAYCAVQPLPYIVCQQMPYEACERVRMRGRETTTTRTLLGGTARGEGRAVKCAASAPPGPSRLFSSVGFQNIEWAGVCRMDR
ncbi:unnamed protein product, partial [Iphiclides podalirius]